jgi:nicotinate phosphoribosyltransferase
MIIQSLLDTDLYKFSMQQAVLHRYPSAMVEYRFICRNRVNLTPLRDKIRDEVNKLCELTFHPTEILYLKKLGLFSADYLAMLRTFRLNKNQIGIREQDGRLDIQVYGPWWQTILFEVPVLAIVSELYYSGQFADFGGIPQLVEVLAKGHERNRAKVEMMMATAYSTFQLMEFGTRRRFSRGWQESVMRDLLPTKDNPDRWNPLIGTSNVHLARTMGLQPLGTMAHEWLQAHQALVRLEDFQRVALETWMMEYRGQLGIALTDCISRDAFCQDFDLLLAKAYDGVRHDSGCPYKWADQMLAHYESLGINPESKTLVFSDGLTVEKAIKIAHHYAGHAKTVFGIGTHLTNDMGFGPLSIVMKMVRCNDKPVAKISDEPEKAVCIDPEHLKQLKRTFRVF